GRRQFSLEKANSVRNSTPRSAHPRTVARTASAPLRCPATRGRCRFRAQRPLPSMMMAICRGTGPTSGIASVVLLNKRRPSLGLHRQQVGFLLLQDLVDLADRAIGELLHLLLGLALLILRDLLLLQHLL